MKDLPLSQLGALITRWVCVCAPIALLGMGHTLLHAQDSPEASERPLIDSVPYDLVVLNDTAGGKSVKIAPIAERNMTQRPPDTTKLEVVLLKYPDRRYEVLWRDIKRIELYERMIYDEALRKLAEKDFITAFMDLSFLMQNYPKMPQLETLRREFLFKSAVAMFAESRSDFNRYFQTLATLEELKTTAPDFEEARVASGLSSVIDAILNDYKSKGDLASAKRLLERLDSKYGDSLPSVKRWKDQFFRMAQARKDEAIALMNAGKYREARKAALDMQNISSAIEGGAELVAEVRKRHPMVRVGVMQRSGELDACNMFSWSARRAGALVYRPVVTFKRTGGEGGEYEFALGKMKLSDDHQQLSLTVDAKNSATLNAFDLSQIISNRATPGSATYDASWAAIVKAVSTPGPTQILVQLQRPHVLPYALMQFVLRDEENQKSPLPASYQLKTVEGNEVVFGLRNATAQPDQPVEIIEVFYDDPKTAFTDLLRGEIDVLDQIFPSDAKRYGQSERTRMGNYALPSIHMLVPVSNNSYLAMDKYRRALMYATNRAEILRGELLNSDDSRDGRLVSGPFPIGIDKNDPLNYAYDPKIEPIDYDPRLARLLLHMVDRDLGTQSNKLRVPVPEKKPLRIGVPDFELARVAVQALIQQWALVGVKSEMIVLSKGKAFDKDAKCDLVYLTASMWEPAVDIERLLGGNGPASSSNPFIIQALTRLRQARTWRDVRTSLQDLHRLVDYHLPILPLWQITDRFAYSPQLQGLSPGAITLYENVSAWRISNPSMPVATSASPP